MLQNSGDIAGVLPINGVEVEVLKTKRHVKFISTDRASPLAKNWPQALFRRRREGFKRGIVRESNTRGRRGNRQLRDLNANRFIDRSEAGEEISLEMCLMLVGDQRRACAAANAKRSKRLRDHAH